VLRDARVERVEEIGRGAALFGTGGGLLVALALASALAGLVLAAGEQRFAAGVLLAQQALVVALRAAHGRELRLGLIGQID
jgi:hypothetical protein